jgi:uncharacterized protein YjdB
MTTRPYLRALLITAAIFATTSCGGSSGDTVEPETVASVQVTAPTSSVATGGTVQLSATPRTASGAAVSGKTISWSSSANQFATVSNSGLVTGIAAGSATITASVDGKAGTTTITVLPVPVATVTLSPPTANVLVGATTTLQAVAKDAAQNTLTGRTATWSTDNAAVATVANGVVTGVSAGQATITATIEGKTGTAVVTVALVPVATLTLDPPASSVLAGATVQLTPTMKDAQGNVITGRTPTWTSSNNTLATVSATGQVTTLAPGNVTISATRETIVGNATIEIVDPKNIPAFVAPFTLADELQTSNYFDHDIPKQFVDANGNYVTWWGENSAVGIDGHSGYDWRLPVGTPIRAVAAGTVTFAGTGATFFCPIINANTANPLVTLTHTLPGGVTIRTQYVHLSRIDVATGAQVTAGQQIGLAGGEGCALNPHLHLEVVRTTQTNSAAPAPIDPFGWSGAGTDPWQAHADGAASIQLWKTGEAPSLFRRIDLELNPGASNLFVAITRVRFQGVRDDITPNNEYVEVTRDNRFAPAVLDLTGFTLRNNAGDVYTFPAGFTLTTDRTSVRVFTGAGVNTATELYWGQASGKWNNRVDCVRFLNAGAVLRNQASIGGGCAGAAGR